MSWDLYPCKPYSLTKKHLWGRSSAEQDIVFNSSSDCCHLLPCLPPPPPLPPTRPNLAPATLSGSTMHSVRCLVAIGKTVCLPCFEGLRPYEHKTQAHTHIAQTHRHIQADIPSPPPSVFWLTNGGPRPILPHLQQRRPESHGSSEPTDSPAHRFRQGGAGRDDWVWCHSREEKLGGPWVMGGGHPYSALPAEKH